MRACILLSRHGDGVLISVGDATAICDDVLTLSKMRKSSNTYTAASSHTGCKAGYPGKLVGPGMVV